MENGRLAKISVFIALFIAFVSMCLTVKLHMDIENNLDILNYGITDEAEQQGENKTYTAKALTETSTTQEETATEAVIEQQAVTEKHTQTSTKSSSKSSKSSNSSAANNAVAGAVAEQATQAAAITEAAIAKQESEPVTQLDSVFVFSKNSKKLHSRTCPYAAKIKEENRKTITIDELQEYLDNGYEFCANCQGCTTVE